MIIGLVLVITVSLIAGTLAYYQITIDPLATGTVSAKEFTLTGEGSQAFAVANTIAPGEEVSLDFSVYNHEKGNNITQTDMNLVFKIKLEEDKHGSSGPLLSRLDVVVYQIDSDDKPTLIDTDFQGGIYTFAGTPFVADTADSRQYQVLLKWPYDKPGSEGEASHTLDTPLAGANEVTCTVSVVGTQVNPNPSGGNEGQQHP